MKETVMVNCLLTRKCNLRCEYCDLIKEYEGMPDEYPNPAKIKERGAAEWIEDFETLAKFHHPKDLFFILYGGEPLLWKPLSTLVSWLNVKNLPYTIITNATIDNSENILLSMKARGVSCSVDPSMFAPDSGDRNRKANLGFHLLKSLKEKNKDIDCTAEITVDDNSVKWLPELVEKLSENGIWSSITVFERKKNNYYDFAADCELKSTREIIEPIFKQVYAMGKDQRILIHTPELLNFIPRFLPDNFRSCGGLNNTITINPDGTIRTCLRIQGKYTPTFSVKSLNSSYPQDVFAAWQMDYEGCCLGCAWTCGMMPQVSDHKGIIHK